MGSWLDLVIAAWLFVTLVNGFRAGLFRAGARVAGFFVGFWAAGLLSVRLAGFFEQRLGLAEAISRWLARSGALPASVADQPLSALPLDRLPALMQQAGLSPGYQKMVLGRFGDTVSIFSMSGTNTLGDLLSRMFSQMIIEAVAFLVIFSAVQWGAALLGKVLQVTIGRLPPLWGFNRLGGAAFGLVRGLIGVTVTLGVLAPLAGFLRQPTLTEAMSRSTLAPPFLGLFQWVLRLGG